MQRVVVIGNYGGDIVGLGIRDLVSGFECVMVSMPEGTQLAERIAAVLPVAVVVLDRDDGGELAGELSTRFPNTVAVAVSSTRLEVLVYPRQHGLPYEQKLDGDVLARALG